MTPFGIFAPDQSRFTAGTSPNIVNAVPVGAMGWGSMPLAVEISDALPDECKGAIVARSSTGNYTIYALTSAKAFKLDTSDYSWTDVSRLAGGDYGCPADDFWSLTQFGTTLVATNIADDPQYIDVDTATNFAALPGSPPRAKYGWNAGEHFVLGHHSGFPNRIMTSGIGDAGYWTVGQRGCDYQDLPDGEDVMGAIGAQTGAIIVQRKAIRSMTVGAFGDYSFKVDVLNPARGAIAPYSIVPVNGTPAFLSSDGFSLGVEGHPIGDGLVDKFFYENALPDSIALTKGVVDPYEHIIWWQVTLATGKRILGYNYHLKRWCQADNDVSFFVDLATPAVTIDGLDALYASIDAIDVPFNSRLFSGGLPAFAAFTTNNKLAFFTGANKAATFDTWEMPLAQGRRAFLQEARVATDATTHTLKVAAADRFSGTEPTFGSAVSPDSSTGICHFRSDGYMHKFRAEIAEGESWSHVLGLEDIRAVPSGRR